MYVTYLKTVAREGMKNVFDDDYPENDFKRLLVSLEFPAKKQDYPSIWVDWEPLGAIQNAGVNHFEELDLDGEGLRRYFRWRFTGSLTFTLVALTSLERDRLVDEVVKVFAFGRETQARTVFRDYLEQNEYIGVNANFDEIDQRGFAASPGTPWGTEDVIYEATLAIQVIGEFTSDGIGNLVPISAIKVYPRVPGETDPLPDDVGWQ